MKCVLRQGVISFRCYKLWKQKKKDFVKTKIPLYHLVQGDLLDV